MGLQPYSQTSRLILKSNRGERKKRKANNIIIVAETSRYISTIKHTTPQKNLQQQAIKMISRWKCSPK